LIAKGKSIHMIPGIKGIKPGKGKYLMANGVPTFKGPLSPKGDLPTDTRLFKIKGSPPTQGESSLGNVVSSTEVLFPHRVPFVQQSPAIMYGKNNMLSSQDSLPQKIDPSQRNESIVINKIPFAASSSKFESVPNSSDSTGGKGTIHTVQESSLGTEKLLVTKNISAVPVPEKTFVNEITLDAMVSSSTDLLPNTHDGLVPPPVDSGKITPYHMNQPQSKISNSLSQDTSGRTISDAHKTISSNNSLAIELKEPKSANALSVSEAASSLPQILESDDNSSISSPGEPEYNPYT